MARQSHTPLTAQGAYGGYAANAADLTMLAADVANKELVALTGTEIVVAHNTDTLAHTVTITSTSDPYGRTKDITAYNLSAGEYAVFGPFELPGWQQTDGKLYFEANHATVKLGVVKLPR